MAEITQAGIDALKEQLDEVEGYLRLDERRQVVMQLEATSTAPGFWDDAEAASGVMAELTQAKDEVSRVDAARQRIGDIQAAFDLGQETGEEELLDEADGLAAALGRELSELELASWFSDELDHGDAIVTITPGQGGLEAQDWCGMLFHMYLAYCERRGWKVTVNDAPVAEAIGIDRATFTVSGKNAYGMLRGEQGVHRLVRISPTDAKKRRQTTFAGVGLGRIDYYRQRKDPDFEAKEHNVLVVYKQLALAIDERGELVCGDEDGTPGELARGDRRTHVVSVDEKPGIQAIATTAEDLRPRPGAASELRAADLAEAGGGSVRKRRCGKEAVRRDYEYRRLGTVSLLAGIDLEDGHAFPLVSDTHKSSDFCRLLALLDAHYPEGEVIRLVLDNHSAHKSKETRAWLQAHPGRFELVFTPTHGSWLNMVEGFFAKMTHQMLCGIRVASKEELAERIYRYFDEVNAVPVIHRWRHGMGEIDRDEKPKIGLAY